MNDVYFWIAFFAAPVFLMLVTAFVFRPSAAGRYREAKYVIFSDAQDVDRRRGALRHREQR
ncbi:MAG: hypothetical protein WBN68_08850 [Sedimenticolaceae bacterium]